MHALALATATGVLALAVVGCIPLPFVTPPLSVSAGVGPAMGKPIPPRSGVPAAGVEPQMTFRGGLRPLGLPANFEDRTFDFSLGYVGELFPKEEHRPFSKHGAYLGLTHYPWVHHLDDTGWFARLGINAMAETLWTHETGDFGGGATFTADMELTRHAQGAFSGWDPGGGGVVGGAYGEGGVGLQVAGGVRGVGEARYWTLTFGITFRVPATAGFALIPIWDVIDANE